MNGVNIGIGDIKQREGQMMTENNNEMKMLVEEYKEQIELMKQQYGQEEDLYPWIYMLLMKSGKTNNLSMRQVAGASWAECVRGRELLRGYAGFPDIAIVDKDFYAVNIKSIESKKRDIANWIARGLIQDKDVNVDSEGLLKYMEYNEEIKGFFKDYWYLYNIDKIRGCIEAKILGDRLIEFKSESEKNKSLKIDMKQNQPIFKVGDKDITSFNEGIEYKDIIQLLGELLWYGKVIYTNGKEWKYLEVIECSNNKKIRSIVDLRRTLYKKCVYIQKPTELWYKLISDLQNLKRNKLKIKINCENKSICDEGFIAWFIEKVNF